MNKLLNLTQMVLAGVVAGIVAALFGADHVELSSAYILGFTIWGFMKAGVL